MGDDGTGGTVGCRACGDCDACTADAARRRRWAVEVRAALSGLEPVQREAVALAYFQRLSHREIAGRLAVPLPEVRAAVAGGLARLAARLA